ncbi:AtzH-like domain-containing protein [Pseudoclavibacter sp. Z016]|uniref:AtzH-like domain-containing protein n=1 Tax=Pseudoclavibacter sp. Z016 TaxID=2080581 RepID=UPI0015E462D9|nr:AtzH-like domain-containing protein [Pseudoclavibacter sp. Z016]
MTSVEQNAPETTLADGTPPAALLAAFEAYERAVQSNDLDELDAWFAPGDATLRGDDSGLLVGHEQISEFRAQRGGVAKRTIERIEYRALADGVALLVSTSRFATGGLGLQTQLWQQLPQGWRITAAHVTPRPRAFDRSIWRTVGDPLFQGAWEGPLEGLTVAVKDLFAIRGYRIGAGNPSYLDSAKAETRTAPAVRDLLRGGASLRGIARTDEFAYSIAGDNAHFGTPPNAAVPGALPGGSSSGPASAVANGQADIGLATDTAGSVRIPASYQGLWGLRTTHDLVPRQGLLPLAQSFDTVGWLTRDGETLQRVADWCLSYDSSESTASAAGQRGEDLPGRLVVPAEVLAAASPETVSAFEAFLHELEERGAVAAPVERVSIGELASYQEPFRIVQGAEAWRNNRPWLEAHPGATGPAVAARFLAASQITEAQEQAARDALAPLSARLERLVHDAVLLFPTAPGAAPSRAADASSIDAIRTATLRMTTPAAVAGLPALSAPLLSVPTTSSAQAAPVGVCFVSRAGSDLALVRLGRRLASAAAPTPRATSRAATSA